MEKYQFSQMQKKDERVRIITEILNGIKVIKLYGWELSFVKRINSIRQEEMHQLKIFQFLEATQFFAWTSAPLMVALASFATFVLIDPQNNILDSQTAFVSLTLFNTMRGPLFLLPFGIVSIIQGIVSINRINTFLNLEEINPDNVKILIYNKPIFCLQNTNVVPSSIDSTTALSGYFAQALHVSK